jgi:hypothetical protein
MRSFRLLAVTVLAVILALSSMQNAYAISVSVNPRCGAPGTFVTLTVVGPWVTFTVSTWGSGWPEPLPIGCTDIGCGFTVPPGATGGVRFTATDGSGSSASATFTVDCPAVGGVVEPAKKLAIFAPYLALFGIVAIVAVVFWTRPDN